MRMNIHEAGQHIRPVQADLLFLVFLPGILISGRIIRYLSALFQDLLYPVAGHTETSFYESLLPLEYICICKNHIHLHPIYTKCPGICAYITYAGHIHIP